MLVESFKLGETEVEIYDDACCKTEQEIEKILDDIARQVMSYYQYSGDKTA